MVAVNLISFIPTGAPDPRDLGDWCSDWFLNVKNFGAIGDGNHDDTDAIQDCLDAAFGTSGSPHGASSELNRPVFFPAGNYIVTDTLLITGVLGGLIMGAGSGCTQLTYTGSVAADWTSLFRTDDFARSRVEGLSFVMTGSSPPFITVAFNYNSTNTVLHSTLVTFYDCQFRDATYGLALALYEGDGSGGSPGHPGNGCDTTSIINCLFDNCVTGTVAYGQNSLQHTIIGGKASNCTSYGVHGNGGSFFSIVGLFLDGNENDIIEDSASVFMGGCTSRNNADTAFISTYASKLVGCYHAASSNSFAWTGSWMTVDGCRSDNGVFRGLSGPPDQNIYIRGNDPAVSHPAFGNANYIAAYAPIENI